jgi:WD40 repeat protein
MLIPLSVAAQQADTEKVFGGHLDAVTMGDFTPDGTSIVTVSFDKTARLWEIASQAELQRYTQHTGPIFCLAVSGDGTTLVTGAQDNTVRIWDLPLGKPLRAFQEPDQPVNAIAISPDGNRLVSAAADQTLRIRSLAEAEDQAGTRAGHTADVLSLAYRSDGAYFASSDQAGRVLLWSPYLEGPQAEWVGHDGAISQLQFVSNNQQLLTAGDDGVVRSWQLLPSSPSKFELGETQLIDWSVSSSQSQAVCLAEGGRAFVLNVSNGEITSEYPKLEFKATAVAHAPNNSWVCVGDEAGKTRLLNYTDGVLRGTVAGHQGRINDVAIHADSTRFATCGVDGTVRVWGQPTADDPPQQPLHTLRTSDDAQVAATSVLFTADQQHLLCGAADGRIHQWNIGTGQLARTIDGHADADAPAIRQLVATPNAQAILSIGDDKTLRIWNLNDGSAGQVMQHPAEIRDVAVSPDGARAAVACEDGSVRVWELGTGQLLQTITGHAAAAVGVGFLSDGQTIASASLDKTLRLAKTSILAAMPIHQGAVRSMALYASGTQVVTCGDDQRIVLTNVANGSEVRSYAVKSGEPDTAAEAATEQAETPGVAAEQEIKPTVVTARGDNQRIAAGTESGEILVWNAASGENPLLTLRVGAPVIALSYSPDNQKLAVATAAPAVHIFGPSIPGAQPTLELTGHQKFATDAPITELIFAADNQSVWASLENGHIQQWKYAGIAQRRQMNQGGAVYGVAVGSDGNLAVSCGADQTVRVWDTATGQQKAQLRGHSGPVHAIAISRDETFAVSSGADGTLRLWDIVGGRQLKQLAKFDATMYSIAIHPDGKLVAAAGADRQVHLLDMITGAERQTLTGHSDYIHCVAFDMPGGRLLSYGYAGHLKIWNSADGKLLQESRIGKVGNYARFSPDGNRLLLSNGDGTARVVPVPSDTAPAASP